VSEDDFNYLHALAASLEVQIQGTEQRGNDSFIRMTDTLAKQIADRLRRIANSSIKCT
jgi:hypothetical protein